MERRPGTAPYFLTVDEAELLRELVRTKAARANRKLKDCVLLEDANLASLKAAGLRELLYHLGGGPSTPLHAALKGALDVGDLSRYRNTVLRGGGDDDAGSAFTFLKVWGWAGVEFKGGRLGLWLHPRPGAAVQVLLSGPWVSSIAMAQTIPMLELPALFAKIPDPVNATGLRELGFLHYPSRDVALGAP